MILSIEPAARIQGDLTVPSDKSLSHRATLLGALATGVTRVGNFLWSADCLATVRCLRGLGIRIEQEPCGDLLVHGRGLRGFAAPDSTLDCGGSGTTMRLLSGILAGQLFTSALTGSEALRRRPMDRVIEPLRRMGADIHGREDRFPPLQIRGGNLHGVAYRLPMASAQVKSAILLAALYADSPTVVIEPAPTRDHTERMVSALGIAVAVNGVEITLDPKEVLQTALPPMNVLVPGDLSSAAFFLVAACLLPGSELWLRDVGVNPTRTGLIDVLRQMGADIGLAKEHLVSGEPVADIYVRASDLRGVEIGGETVPRMIDEFPILAVAATQADGTTVVRDAAELRVKESDRISTLAAELRRMGARIEEQPDGFVIEGPTRLCGAEVEAHHDHRLAMSLAVAGLLAEGQTRISGAECIADSFPDFELTLSRITQRRS
jgi:3-phosphoshikimate 1-carboxyvinyltransferase